MILTGLSSSAFAQSATPQSNSNLEVTATVDPGCFLEADNLNFGILMMPLIDQSATSNMKVKCSKNTPITLDIYYDFSQGVVDSSKGNYTYEETASGIWEASYYTNYKIYLDGVALTSERQDFGCREWNRGEIYIFTNQAANLLGYQEGVYSNNSIDMPLCNGKTINENTFSKILNTETSDIGYLKGVSHAENIVYFLDVPNDASKKWGVRNNYKMVSSGVETNVVMKAHIKRADNPTHKMTPDTYQSTLTVVLTY